jgi:hypothetical protein
MKIYGDIEGAYSLMNRTLRANILLILPLLRAYQSLADIPIKLVPKDLQGRD